MVALARILRCACVTLAVVAIGFVALCAWGAVADYRMQVREGWEYRCGTVQIGALILGTVGLGVSAAAIAGYRKATRWEHTLPTSPPA